MSELLTAKRSDTGNDHLVNVTVTPPNDEAKQQMRLIVNSLFLPKESTPYTGESFTFVCISPRHLPDGAPHDKGVFFLKPEPAPPLDLPVIQAAEAGDQGVIVEILSVQDETIRALEMCAEVAQTAGFMMDRTETGSFRLFLKKEIKK